MQQGSSVQVGGLNNDDGVSASNNGTATLTDEQILGIDDARANAVAATATEPRQPEDILDATSQAVEPPGAAAAARAGESEPEWLRALEAQPEAAAEARRWRAAAGDSAQLDAAYFSDDPGSRAGLAARLYDTDPVAFRSMLAEGARMLSARDPQGLAELARQLGATPAQVDPPPTASAARTVSQAARPTDQLRAESRRQVELSAPKEVFPVENYRAFEAAANDDVARRVHEAIDGTLRGTLPEGIADGARRRIGEDIFQEVHASLAGDRDLSRQIGEVLRDWRFDSAARQQVTALLAGRARAVLPEVARRVVGEWTSSVLASDRAKSARIAAAASRHDITGGRLPETVPSSALRSRDVDYNRLSDEQILDL